MKDLVSDGFAQVVKPYIDAQDKTTREILAPVETDETDASKAYQIGDQLILGGILYDVIAPISQHGIITSTGSGANIEEADNITEQINSVNSAIKTLTNKANNKVLYLTEIACSATTGNFTSYSNSAITADHVLAECVFANPSAITTDVTWTTASGSLVLNGTCSTATTVNVVLVKKDN